MSVYIYPIATAIALFPILSALFTLPYVIYQYHKYGALLILRILIVYSFIFYMMTSYFMTILPLPPIDSVKDGGTSMLLVPFAALKLWFSTSGLVLNDPSTYAGAFINYNFLQIAFNIILLLPFGVYLRYYFERKWYQVLILSFLYSLFFELTQLSGLYGIYPHPYRWFEVDDLICNTLGGMVGFWVTPLCSFFLPSRDRLDEMSYRKGKKVSFLRRLIGFLIDVFVVLVIGNVVIRSLNVKYAIKDVIGDFTYHNPVYILFMFFLLFVSITFFTWISGGRSPGKYIVNMKVVSDHKRHPGFFALLIRYGIVYLIVLPIPEYIYILLKTFNETQSDSVKLQTGVVMIVLATVFLLFVLIVFISAITRKSQYFYEKLTNTRLESTIKVKDNDSAEKESELDTDSDEKLDENFEDAEDNTQEDAQDNMQEDAEHTTQQDVQDNMQESVDDTTQEDMQDNMQKNTEHTTQQDAQDNMQESVEENTQEDMQDNTQESVDDTTQEDMQNNMQKNAEHTTQQDAQDTTQKNAKHSTDKYAVGEAENIGETDSYLTDIDDDELDKYIDDSDDESL